MDESIAHLAKTLRNQVIMLRGEIRRLENLIEYERERREALEIMLGLRTKREGKTWLELLQEEGEE